MTNGGRDGDQPRRAQRRMDCGMRNDGGGGDEPRRARRSQREEGISDCGLRNDGGNSSMPTPGRGHGTRELHAWCVARTLRVIKFDGWENWLGLWALKKRNASTSYRVILGNACPTMGAIAAT